MVLILQSMRICEMCSCTSKLCGIIIHHLYEVLCIASNIFRNGRSCIIAGIYKQTVEKLIKGNLIAGHQNDLANISSANQLELERLEQMLDYLNTHFESVISLQELADQVHLSKEVCCRLFKKMTGKTITGYLEEYRVNQSLPLVQSSQYSMIQIADMTGFSNASRLPGIPQTIRMQSR